MCVSVRIVYLLLICLVPPQGAQKDGMKGMVKGTFQGVSGLVFKPVSGALTAVGQVSKGVEQEAMKQLDDAVPNEPYRPRRILDADGTLVPYRHNQVALVPPRQARHSSRK